MPQLDLARSICPPDRASLFCQLSYCGDPADMRSFLILFACLLALYGLIAWAFLLFPFEASPGFYRNVDPKGQTYLCIDDRHSRFFVRYENEGRIAVVSVDGKTLRLAFERVDFLDEVYSNGPWRLYLDPEANLYGPGGLHFGNCG